MNDRFRNLARTVFDKDYEELPQREQRVIRRIAARAHISRDTNRGFDAQLSFGERLADRVATFGGSWTFIILFALMLAVWVVLNSVILLRHSDVFDPYPYVFLNLILSMLAAVQAPVIMMSQNRQAAKDRLDAEHDYEVNLKAELEVTQLHAKLDDIHSGQLNELATMQREHGRLLALLVDHSGIQSNPADRERGDL